MYFLTFDTPLGAMGLGEEKGALVRLCLPGEDVPQTVRRETALLSQGRRQLLEYLSGARQRFDLLLAPEGTDFQRRVWAALLEIPWGETATYGELARRIGSPRAVRAVGQANHHNPIPILIPCHRVVGADGGLAGYRGGMELKKKLLLLESTAAGRDDARRCAP